jgi:trigger factor
MVKVSTEKLPESQVALRIEVEDERLERAKESAYRRLVAKAKIPGFRPGKAPRAVLERHLGGDAVLQEALDRLMPELYREALAQEGIEPVDRAEYELEAEDPLVAKFTVPVRPTVDLGDYRALRIAREPVVVETERVQEQLEILRQRYATYEPVARPVQWGDIVRADVQGTIDGTVFVREEDAEFRLLEGRAVSLPGFAEALLGHAKGEEFELDLPVPEDAPDERWQGKTARYRVHLKELKQELLPELDDELARQVGEGFASLEALRTRIAEDLRKALEEVEERRYHDRLLDGLAERAQLEYPPVLVEREAERLLEDETGAARAKNAKNAREGLERYLQRAGKTEEELREEFRPIAERRVRRSLVLSQVTEAEHIDVTGEEVEAEVERLSAGAGAQADELRRLFSTENAKESLRRSLLSKKTLDRLVEIASGEEPTPDEAAAGAAQDE